jgi:hypothetical protein
VLAPLTNHSVSLDELLRNRINTAAAQDEVATRIIDMLHNVENMPLHVHRSLSSYSIQPESGLLLKDNLIYIPDDKALKTALLSSHRNTVTAGHFRIAKTYELLARNYFWPGMRRFVTKYITTCEVCQRDKVPRREPVGHLRPLDIPTTPWSSISMDFIVGLPESAGYTCIWVVVDRLTKMAHFTPCRETIDAHELAALFLKHIIRLHGMPTNIVSDRGTLFTSAFWRSLLHLMGTTSSLSTAFHPQTDGQTERVNAILEQYLRMYMHEQQDDWESLLPLAEFTYNNSIQSSIHCSPFFANYGRHPRFQILPLEPTNPRPSTAEFTSQLKQIHEDLQSEMALAQLEQATYYDDHWQPTPTYTVGQYVFVSRRNLRSRRPSDKLDHRYIGPFRILARVGSHAYRLELPSTVRIHPVFHVSLLLPAENPSSPELPARDRSPTPAFDYDPLDPSTT